MKKFNVPTQMDYVMQRLQAFPMQQKKPHIYKYTGICGLTFVAHIWFDAGVVTLRYDTEIELVARYYHRKGERCCGWDGVLEWLRCDFLAK